MAPVEQQRTSKHLAQFSTDERRELFRDVMPIIGTLGSNPDLDEFMRLEGFVDRRNDPVRKAIFTKLHERIEVMAEGAEVSFLFSGEAHTQMLDRVWGAGALVATPLFVKPTGVSGSKKKISRIGQT